MGILSILLTHTNPIVKYGSVSLMTSVAGGTSVYAIAKNATKAFKTIQALVKNTQSTANQQVPTPQNEVVDPTA